MPPKSPGQQEALFLVAEQTGQITPVDFTHDTQHPSVHLAERSIHLQNVITILAQKSMLEGFVSFDTPADESYGERASQVRAQAQDKIHRLDREAKYAFAHASGLNSMLEAGYDTDETKALTRGLYAAFVAEFYGSVNYKKAQAFRRSLAESLDASSQQLIEVAEAPTPEQPLLAEQKLNNHEKLEAIRNDERAGFLPATNREKTMTLTLLDYVGKPVGTAQQLIEVFRHSQGFIRKGDTVRTAGASEGKRAVESVIYEMGDFASDATRSHEILAAFQAELAGVLNPQLRLEVVFGNAHPAYAALRRYEALKKLYESKNPEVSAPATDPMRTVEDRWAKEGEGKHKSLHSKYTTPNQSEEVAQEIAHFASNTTIRDVRTLVMDALTNEERRAEFFLTRLKEVRALQGISRVFASLVEVAEEIVGEHQKAA